MGHAWTIARTVSPRGLWGNGCSGDEPSPELSGPPEPELLEEGPLELPLLEESEYGKPSLTTLQRPPALLPAEEPQFGESTTSTALRLPSASTPAHDALLPLQSLPDLTPLDMRPGHSPSRKALGKDTTDLPESEPPDGQLLELETCACLRRACTRSIRGARGRKRPSQNWAGPMAHRCRLARYVKGGSSGRQARRCARPRVA